MAGSPLIPWAQGESKSRKWSVGHPTIFLPTKGLHVCVCGHPKLHVQTESLLPLGPFGPKCVPICGFVALWKSTWGLTCSLWRRFRLFWQAILGCSGNWEHDLEAKFLAPSQQNPLTHELLHPWGRSQWEEEQDGSLNPKSGRAGGRGFGEVLIRTAPPPCLWQRYCALDNQLHSHLIYE